MKTCKQCGDTKPLSAYYQYGSGKPFGSCKYCVKKNARANRAAKIEHYRAYDRDRNRMPHRIDARSSYYDVFKDDPERQKRWAESKRAWAKRNRDKRSAHILVNNAIRDGLMCRLPCERCGDGVSEAHHDDYRYPLNVRWLCKRCHSDCHTSAREAARATNKLSHSQQE